MIFQLLQPHTHHELKEQIEKNTKTKLKILVSLIFSVIMDLLIIFTFTLQIH